MRRPPSRRLVPAVAAAIAVVAGGSLLAPAATATPSATSPGGSALAVTPPMGFNNWARFGCDANNPNTGDVGPSESLILNQASAMVGSGLSAVGYNTVTIDDCWMTGSRDASGNLQVNTAKFPHGMAYIGTQLHNEGLKFGIYEDIGSGTCGGLAGSFGHFQQDADLFASWGVDYVKLDGCNMPGAYNNAAGYVAQYTAFGAALKNNASKRDMVFSESSPAYFSIGPTDLGPWYSVIDGATQSGQLWRSGYDVKMYQGGASAWTSNGNGAGVLTQYGYNSQLSRYSSPGSWNDPDFLITGDKLTDAESRSQFALYSIMAAPLIMSTDVANLSAVSLATLKNTAIIAVDQDPLGAGGYRVSGGAGANSGTGVDLAVKPLSDGSLAAVVLNKNSTTLSGYSLSLSALGLDAGTAGCGYTVKDLWQNQGWTGNAVSATASVSLASIGSHDNAMLKISPNSSCHAPVPTGQITASPTGIDHAPLCLERYEPAGGATAAVDIATCAGSTRQQWQMNLDGTVRLVEPGTGGSSLCLTAPSGTTTGVVNGQQGQWLSVDTCGAAADAGHQNWAYDREGNLVLSGTAANAGQCVDVYGATTGTTGTAVDLAACNVAPDAVHAGQAWAAPTGATTYQADRAGTRGGSAEVDACPACPDGNLVGFIGGTTNSGTLTFGNITVPTAGTYQLQIDYINGGATRTDDVTVNGTMTPIAFPGNGSWTTTQSELVAVSLNAGANTVEFGNPTGWAASIATVSVPDVPIGTIYNADTAGTLAGGAVPQACSCFDGYVAGNLGNNSGTLTFANVTVQTAGTYRMRVSYINGGGTRTDDITVNGAAPVTVSFPGGGSWSVPLDLTVTVTLHAGTNTIGFGNPTGWAASVSTVTI